MTPRIALLTLSCIISLSSIAQKKARLINSGEIIQAGIKLYDDGKYKDALVEFEKIPAGDTNYVWALYESALTCTADSQYNRGIVYCEKGLNARTEKHRHPELLSQYASLLDYSNQQARSLEVFDSAIALYPAYTSLYVNKGTTLIRMEKYAEAEKVFQQALLINPYSSSCMFKMGIAAWGQGKMVPAFLSMIGNLMVEPDGRFSRNAINVLSEITKSTDAVTQLIDKRKEDPSENFSTVELILLSKIALDPNYKIITELDDPIARQVQVAFEKLRFDESEKDFYMQFFVPLYKKIFDEKKYEYFVNYIFSDVNIPKIQEFNKKKKKDIESLKNDIIEYYNLVRQSRELQFSKRSDKGSVYQFSNGALYGKGAIATKDDITGPWTFFYAAGNKKGEGSFNEKGERNGAFTFYYFNGKVRGKEFYKNGKQEGEEVYYHDNGVVASRGTYKNGAEDGQHTSYFEEGMVKTVQNYSNGKLNGISRTYSKNGILLMEENYKDGVRDGAVKNFHEGGTRESEASYTDDKLDGNFKGWHKDGSLSVEGIYVKDNLNGPLKRYYENGKLSTSENYTNGLSDGEYTSYYDNGQAHYSYMNNKGKSTGDINYYDRDGKLYSTLSFDKEVLKTGRYFDKTGKQISISELRQGKLDLVTYDADGSKKALAPYNSKGELDGTKTYFYGSGKVKLKEKYVKGKLNGETVAYFPNGATKYSLNYTDEGKDGYYVRWYQHGGIQDEGWYSNDQLQGEYLSYDKLGNLTSRTWYLNGSRNGLSTDYWPNGKKKTEEFYEMDKLIEEIEFDTTEKAINFIKLENGNGRYISRYPNGKLYGECNYKNGILEGPYKFYYPDGSKYVVKPLKNGMLDSSFITYGFGGKVRSVSTYKMNEKSGIWKYYDESGTLHITEEYKDDNLHGKTVFYFKNGKVDTEIEYKDGERHGLYKRYAQDGTFMYQIRYEFGEQLGYSYFGKDGKLVPEIPFVYGSGKMKSYYANGNISCVLEYMDGVLNGDYIRYHPNGKVFIEDRQSWGDTEGPRKEYYADGKLRSVYNNINNNYHGPYKEYDEKGVLIEEGNYYNDDLHGEQRFYDEKGKLKQVRVYYYGTLLEVK